MCALKIAFSNNMLLCLVSFIFFYTFAITYADSHKWLLSLKLGRFKIPVFALSTNSRLRFRRPAFVNVQTFVKTIFPNPLGFQFGCFENSLTSLFIFLSIHLSILKLLKVKRKHTITQCIFLYIT